MGRSGSFTSWVPGAPFVAKMLAAFPTIRAQERDALSVRVVRHFDASKHRRDHASPWCLAGDQDGHLVAWQPAFRPPITPRLKRRRGTLRHPIVRERWRTRRVAGRGCPPPALTEPDLWASHPALRDVGVGGTQSASADAGLAARSYTSGSSICAGTMTCCRTRYSRAREKSPRFAKYALLSVRSTGPQWLSAQRDLRPS